MQADSCSRYLIKGLFLGLFAWSLVCSTGLGVSEAKSFVLDPATYRLGDGGLEGAGPSSARPLYSVPFHLVRPSRLRVVVGELKPQDSPASAVRLVSGLMSLGIALADMGSFGGELSISRIARLRAGPVVFRAPVSLDSRRSPYRSSWTVELAPGDYVITFRANYHEVLAEYDDFSISEVSVDVENPQAAAAPLASGEVHSQPFVLKLPPPGSPEMSTYLRGRAESKMVMELVEARDRMMSLELEVLQLRDALKRAGAGFAPPIEKASASTTLP